MPNSPPSKNEDNVEDYLALRHCSRRRPPRSRMDVTADPSARAQALLKRMNVTEKTAMLHGAKLGYTGGVVGNERLGIPVLQLNDGPQGFRLAQRVPRYNDKLAVRHDRWRHI